MVYKNSKITRILQYVFKNMTSDLRSIAQDNGLICSQIGLCTNSTLTRTKQTETVAAVKAETKPTLPKQSLCDMCKLVVTFIKPYVDNNSTEVSVLIIWRL